MRAQAVSGSWLSLYRELSEISESRVLVRGFKDWLRHLTGITGMVCCGREVCV